MFDGLREHWEPLPEPRWWLVPLILVLLILAGVALAAECQQGDIPDDHCTPGVVASTDPVDVCGIIDGQTYSQRHRQTSAEMKAEVRRRYGMARCGEIDHRLPLALGGADTVENLWCQPGEGTWPYRLKDKLEVTVWRQVCHEHSKTLSEGQAIFLEPDWRDEYCQEIGGAPCP